ncbi:MAG: tetratricopeptide repeat protein [Acidimicrobiia bacterium]|nr:tetratricopeptide repeat protein [Acidimicrobiia bacterium]
MDVTAGTESPLRFGSFVLDVRSRELRTGARSVRLQEQPFEILCMMLERPGHVVTREELRRRLWPDGTFVDFEHSLNAAVKRLRAALGDDADNPRFVETLPRRGYRFICALGRPAADTAEPPPATPSMPRLAVLPFLNLTEDSCQEYFTDGLTEEMIAQLGQMCRGRIGVIARWSSAMFKDTRLRASEVGQALKADYLLEGSVRREGDRVRVTARLIHAADETHLWAESYERNLTECLSVQAEVAARIAQSLSVELAPAAPLPAQGAAASASAYQEYLRGRYHWNNYWNMRGDVRPGHEACFDQALSGFAQALALEPHFAPAHAMTARVHVGRAEFYLDQPRRALEIARTSAKRALELEPGLAESHLALGDVRRMLEWDWRGAELAYAQAIALNPSQENAHRRYAVLLACLSRRAEAVREAERACDMDPLCLIVGVSSALVQYLVGEYDGAIERCRRTMDLDPQFLPAQRLLAAANLQLGRTRDALEGLEAVHAAAPHDPIAAAWLAHAKAVTGDRTGALDRLAHVRKLGQARYLSPFHIAIAHAGLGDTDEAFAALETATVEADPALASIVAEPRFEPLRADPRYTRLVDLLGL